MKKKANNIQNLKLYKSLSALTQKSLEIVTKFARKDLIARPEGTWIKHGTDSYIRREINRPIWMILLHSVKDKIENTKEFNIFSEVTMSDKIISSQLYTLVGTGFGRSRLELFDIAIKLIYIFLTDEAINEFDDSIFKSEYLKIETSLYSSEIEIETITPLGGFYTDTNKILLDESLSIVKLSEPEIIDFLGLGIKIGDNIGPGDFILLKYQFAIKRTFSLPKLIGDKDLLEGIEALKSHRDRNQEQKVLDALRLFKNGKVYSLGTVTRSTSVFSSGISYNPGLHAKSFIQNKFQLVKDEIDDFLEFWESFRGLDISKYKFISVAIRRYSQSNERENIEDKIIDYLISAEALFLSSTSNFQGELKYRLSHRAAMFIENEAENQREVFQFMQKAYDVRSDIVHGRKLKLPKKGDGTLYSLDEFSDVIETHLRLFLKRVIALAVAGKIPDKFIEWESIIFPKDN